MSGKIAESYPWGKYAPRGRDSLLLLISKLGLAHGPVKRVVGRHWMARHSKVPVDVTYNDMKFRLHPWDNTIESKMLFASGKRERSELKVLQRFLSAGGIFLDIGANIGYYAIMAAASGAGRILAFEPNPVAYSRLQFNISANSLGDRIVALPVALGEQSANAFLSIAEGDMGGSKISATQTSGASTSVTVKALSSVLAEETIDRIDALKIDVEGMEDSILFPFFEAMPVSMWPLLVILEPNQQQWKRDILSWMLKAGYSRIGQTRSNVILQLL